MHRRRQATTTTTMSLIYTQTTTRNNLYLGGKEDAKSLPKLQQRNVRRILNITPAKEAGITAGVPNFFEGNKIGPAGFTIQYKRISVYDASTSDLLPHADEIVNFISNGLHHGSVLVHCQRGVSRSATAVMMFLIRKVNMTYKQSLSLCQRRRPVVNPIPAFCDQLIKYEKECRDWGYLTAVDGEDKVKRQASTCADSAGVNGKMEASSSGKKRKVEVDNEPNETVELKKSQTVGPMPPIQNSAEIGPTFKQHTKGPSVAVKPIVGSSKGPSDSKLAPIIPNGADTADIFDTKDHKKRVIGPARPPQS